jgi:phosphatidylglycerol---prolipoprotein diacylglyceryl transferase
VNPFNPALVHGGFEAAGYAAGAAVYARERRRRGDALESDERLSVLLAAAAGAFLGSRLLAGVADPSLFTRRWSDPAYWMSVKTIVGALLGGWVAVEWMKRRLSIRRRTGDLLAMPLAVGIAVGRIGCFLAGPADRTAGSPTELPWGVRMGDSIPRHPVALYEIAFLALLALVLGRRDERRPEGAAFRIFLGSYLAFRVAVDFLKPDPPRVFAGLSLLQWASAVGAVVAFASWRPARVPIEQPA